ncbi:MAG: hypothetical protein HY690_04690 [Chloroflexi bacterium]|nr:hypothetical protein [Chloroflexota bacterium]
MASDAAQAYARACVAQGEAEVERLRAEVRASAERVTQLSAQLRAASRAIHAARTRLGALEALLATEQARFEQEFEQLATFPKVRGVEMDGALIRVLTDTIYLDHLGRRYRIGEFALELDLDRGIRTINLSNTGQKSGWDHPHVQAGLPCLGNLRDGFEKLLGEYQVVPLVSMLIQFLETFNPDTAYGPIDLWEKVAT